MDVISRASNSRLGALNTEQAEIPEAPSAFQMGQAAIRPSGQLDDSNDGEGSEADATVTLVVAASGKEGGSGEEQLKDANAEPKEEQVNADGGNLLFSDRHQTQTASRLVLLAGEFDGRSVLPSQPSDILMASELGVLTSATVGGRSGSEIGNDRRHPTQSASRRVFPAEFGVQKEAPGSVCKASLFSASKDGARL